MTDTRMTPTESVVEQHLGTVRVRVEYATFTRRGFAFLLDVALVAMFAGLLASITHGRWTGSLVTLFILIWFVGATAEGGTIGKRLLSLRVVRADGGRVSLLHAFLREPIGKSISTFGLLGGFFWMLDQPQRRCWHDIVANTVVVREVREGAPEWAVSPPWLRRPEREVVDAPVLAQTVNRVPESAP